LSVATDIPRIAPLGDAALLLTFGDTIGRDIAQRVRAVAWTIDDARIPGVSDVVPAYTTLAVHYDPARIAADVLEPRLLELAASTATEVHAEGREVVIPVRYDGEDLAWIAESTGMSVDDVIRRHSDVTYYAYMLGFVPGFAYLGDLDPALVLPRRASPRPRVRAGSVAIAGAQTAVYALDTPGGWHIVGHTDVVMFDPHRATPSLIQAGDTVRFEPVTS
jgi:inhibitor of KinA